MSSKVRRNRWSDHDSYLGPFTYARDERHYRPLAIILGSGDNDESPGCRLRLSGFGHTLLEPEPGEECGRWRNGKLAPLSECLKAGSEECDWECPYSR